VRAVAAAALLLCATAWSTAVVAKDQVPANDLLRADHVAGLPAEPATSAMGSAAAAPATPTSPWWIALVTAGLSGLAALGGALVGYKSNQASARAAIVQKTNELEIDALDRRLSEFVGPFMQLSEENRLLAEELKSRHGGAGLRTLTALLTPGWKAGLTVGEARLLEVVVANGVELRRLLMERGAAMVSPALLPFFSRASTHFRLLDLAYKGGLDADPARYSAYVYPRELDGIMEAERGRLEARRELLRREPHHSHDRMADLVVPAALPAAAAAASTS
jgi:hypothetical protein